MPTKSEAQRDAGLAAACLLWQPRGIYFFCWLLLSILGGCQAWGKAGEGLRPTSFPYSLSGTGSLYVPGSRGGAKL